MTLSTSRQQFLSYETQTPENIQYERKGGIFISHCVCFGFVLFAILTAVIVGIISHFVTYLKIDTSQSNVEFWDETEPFGQSGPPSADLRLPSDVVPSFYRLKLKVSLENSSFSGDLAITLRAKSQVKEIILHSKNLSINANARLSEQIYEKINLRKRRDVDNSSAPTEPTVTEVPSNQTVSDSPVSTPSETATADNATTVSTETATANISTETATANISTTTSPPPESSIPQIVETHVTHSKTQSVKILSIVERTGDRLAIILASPLKPGVDYILELSFDGRVGDSLTGFYKSTYVNEEKVEKVLAVTQFEPTSARAAFPCFDEPAFKAKFEISIQHTKNITALSNMKVSAVEDIPDLPNWQWTHFDRSVEMSTYLVAYILSDFKYLETSYLSKDNVNKTIRVWTRPELLSKANYALTITPKLLEYYEGVFGIPYALDKLDLIAIPDFSSGAMENWGLITFRETTLLFDEESGVPRDKQSVAIDVSHEVAHQWFGNLVTMRWWTDLWLNEGFATYIEYVGVDTIEPEWNMFESFSRDKMDLLRSDALKNTSPVSREVVDASEISQKFDEISYTKGANLIRMLNYTISQDLFYKGLQIYLNKWKYSNAEENDLWSAMTSATSPEPALAARSLVLVMNSWTRQAGYPVVKVTRDYEKGTVLLEQHLFSSTASPYPSTAAQLWHIPVTHCALPATAPATLPAETAWLSDRSATVNIDVNSTQALYVNVGAIGYYRVNYDKKNWQLLSSVLKSGAVKSPITRAQLIDDAFNLAKTSQLNYSDALGLTTYMIDGEDSKIVWDLVLNNMMFLKYNLRTLPGFGYFQDYMKLLLAKQLERLNYGLNKPKDDNEAFLIENLLMWECQLGAERCVRWARAEFDKWLAEPGYPNNPKWTYLSSVIFSTVLRAGGRAEFNALYTAFTNSSEPALKSLIINVLPSTYDESLIATLLERSLSSIPKQYAVGVWSVSPPLGARVAADCLVEQFERVYARFTAMDPFMFPAVLNAAFGFITTNDELKRLKSFALEHKEKLLPMSQTLQKLVDTAVLRIDWIKKHGRDINQWFEDYITGKLSSDGSPNTVSPVSTSASPVSTSASIPESTTSIPDSNQTSSTPLPSSSTDTPTTVAPSP